MSSARGVLTIVGTVVGSAFGPVGAAIGGMVGGAIGGAIDGPVHSSQAILEDLGALKLDYGSTWPRMYGRYRFKVSPVWSSDKRPIAHDEEVDAKGGPSAVNTSYSYEQDWLCWAPLNAVGWARVWRNGELIASRLTESDAETLAASEETSAWASITFFNGAADQMPWSVYEAAVGTANAIAYRHRPSLGFESLDLGNSGQAPLIEVEFYTNGAEGDGSILLDATFKSDTSDVTAAPQATDTITNPEHVSVSGGRLSLDLTSSGSGVVGWSGGKLGTVTDEQTTIEVVGLQCGSPFGGLGGGSNWRFVLAHSASYQASFGAVVTGGTAYLSTMLISSVGEFGGDVQTHDVLQDGDYKIVFDPVAETIEWFYGDTVIRTFERGVYAQVGGIISCSVGITNAITGPAPDSFSYERVLVYAGEPHGATVEPAPVDLADIVKAEALLEWSGEAGALTAADIDVTDLEGTLVTGFAATGSPRESIAALMDAYYFQAVCSDKLYLRMRGGASVAAIPFEDTGAGDGDASEPFCGLERGNDLEVALQVAFTCPGLLRDYEPDTQHSDRLIGESFELRRYQSPIVFEPAEAKGRADTMVYDARVASHTGSLSLSDDYLALEPTDVVTPTDDEGNAYRVRIERETYSRGTRSFDVVLDDPNVLISSGITAETDQRAISIAPPASTELILLDSALLREGDDEPGHYAVVQGSGRWSGAVLYRSDTESGTYGRIATVTTSAVAGETTTALGDWAGGNVFDETNTVRVQVSGGTLSSATFGGVIEDASANLFAIGAHGRWEIIQARDVTLVSTGVYDLSGLLRGRRGTEHAMGSHAIGDTVIKLQSSGIRTIDETAGEIGATRYWQAVSIGGSLAATGEAFTSDSVRLKPLAPVNLRVTNEDVRVLTWDRRTRLPMSDMFGDCPLGEASESYDVEVKNGVGDTVLSTTVSEPSCELEAFAQTFEVGAAHRIRAVSGDYIGIGDGYPAARIPQLKREDSSGQPIGTVPLGGLQATALINDGDDIYVAVINGSSAAYVYRIARTDITGTNALIVSATYSAPSAADPQGLAFDGTDLWVSCSYSGALKKLNALTLMESASYTINTGIGAMVYASGDLWICDRANDEIIQWDIATQAEVQRIACGRFPTDVFVVNGLVFVAADLVQVFDASSGVLIATYVGGLIDTFRQVFAHNGSEVVFADIGTSELVFLDGTTGFEAHRYPIANVIGVSGYGSGNLFASTRSAPGSYQISVSTAAYGTAGIEPGYTATVYQNSATVGRGYPATIEL